MSEKELKNVKALMEIRVKGKKIKEGQVISKEDFAKKGDWQNLVHMKPARLEETSDPVGAPGEKKKAPPKQATKVDGGMPGAA